MSSEPRSLADQDPERGGVPLARWQVEALVRAGTSAPSPGDTRPWRLHASGSSITVALDTERLHYGDGPVSDRAAHVSVGALVLTMAAWSASTGLDAVVRWMPDDAELPQALAELVLTPTAAPDRTLADLGSHVSERRTMRASPRSRRVGEPVRARLGEAAASHDAVLTTVDPTRRQRLLDIVRLEDASHGFVAPDPAHRRLGPELLVLSTAGDGPVDWMRAGAALQETWLTATGYGASLAVVDGPVEDAPVRDRLRRDLGRTGWPQVVLRAGYGPSAPCTVPATPWRSFLERWPR